MSSNDTGPISATLVYSLDFVIIINYIPSIIIISCFPFSDRSLSQATDGVKTVPFSYMFRFSEFCFLLIFHPEMESEYAKMLTVSVGFRERATALCLSLCCSLDLYWILQQRYPLTACHILICWHPLPRFEDEGHVVSPLLAWTGPIVLSAVLIPP